MQHTYRSFRIAGILGCALAGMLLMSGCQYLPTRSQTKSPRKTVVTPKMNHGMATVVRVYNLRGIGMEHSTADEIEAFTGIIYGLVVTKEWEKSRSDVQVFGTIMTVKTTPNNHLRIEDYLHQIERAMASK